MMNNKTSIVSDDTTKNIFVGLFSVLMFTGITCFCVFAYFKWIKGKKLFEKRFENKHFNDVSNSNNIGCLNMLFVNNDQKNKYYQVWKEILKIINGGHGELKSSKEIKLLAIYDLPIGHVFKIHSITIVIKSLIEKDNKFYPQISLNHCSYEIKA